MGKVVEAPVYYEGRESTLFLAGGITGCLDWQAQAAQMLEDTPWVVFNPRRKDFPINDPGAAYEQIRWEYDHLLRATAILFWFSPGQIQPIALFELGRWSFTSKPLFVGRDPDYPRRRDVDCQLVFARPGMNPQECLVATVRMAHEWLLMS